MTPKQAYVLENLDRVLPLPYKVRTISNSPRYQLDGVECTAQITGLTVQKLIVKHSDGRLSRRVASCCEPEIRGENKALGKRQPTQPNTLSELGALFSSPISVHKDPRSASAQASNSRPPPEREWTKRTPLRKKASASSSASRASEAHR